MAAQDAKSVGATEKFVDLVFEGGGVKGIALVGALSVLEEEGFQPQNVAGTSAGAIVATLLAAGYSASELRDIILELPFHKFIDTTWEDRIPLIGKPLSILRDLGIYEGDFFLNYMSGLLKEKGVETFAQLVHPRYADQPRYRYKVQVIASDITDRRLLCLPQDADKLGVAPDELNVALAVRMSMSIPVFFEPVRLRNPQTGLEHLIVDGGLLSCYPIWVFDSEGVPEWPTFGLRLVEPQPSTDLGQRLPQWEAPRQGVGAVVEFLKSLVSTMLEAHDRLYIEKDNFARTIAIPTLGVNSTDFLLPRDKAMELYDSGRQAAKQFLATWDFQGYIAEFRQGKQFSRREEIAEEMRRGAAAQ